MYGHETEKLTFVQCNSIDGNPYKFISFYLTHVCVNKRLCNRMVMFGCIRADVELEKYSILK